MHIKYSTVQSSFEYAQNWLIKEQLVQVVTREDRVQLMINTMSDI